MPAALWGWDDPALVAKPIIFLLNPNSSLEMSRRMEESIRSSPLGNSVHLVTFTADSSSPASINNAADIQESHATVTHWLSNHQPLLQSLLPHPNLAGILVACYSLHPLVAHLAALARAAGAADRVLVTGIFEASTAAAAALHVPWGIVTTAAFWEAHLADGVRLGSADEQARFVGVESTGLNAGDFHAVLPEARDEALARATGRLLEREARCVVMGCAGMTALEGIIRRACVESLGEEDGARVVIIDPVMAGVMYIEQRAKEQR